MRFDVFSLIQSCRGRFAAAAAAGLPHAVVVSSLYDNIRLASMASRTNGVGGWGGFIFFHEQKLYRHL